MIRSEIGGRRERTDPDRTCLEAFVPVVILKRPATSYPRTVRLGVGCRRALQDDRVACWAGDAPS